jgi:accessory colonization factor AcfC
MPPKKAGVKTSTVKRTSAKLAPATRNAVVSKVAPILKEMVLESGVELSPAEVKRLDRLIHKGVNLRVPPGAGVAKVSGEVAGSVTVDW